MASRTVAEALRFRHFPLRRFASRGEVPDSERHLHKVSFPPIFAYDLERSKYFLTSRDCINVWVNGAPAPASTRRCRRETYAHVRLNLLLGGCADEKALDLFSAIWGSWSSSSKYFRAFYPHPRCLVPTTAQHGKAAIPRASGDRSKNHSSLEASTFTGPSLIRVLQSS